MKTPLNPPPGAALSLSPINTPGQGIGPFRIFDRAAATNDTLVQTLKVLADDDNTDRATLLNVLKNAAATNKAIVESARNMIREGEILAEAED